MNSVLDCVICRFSVGTAYGFTIFDYAQRKAILSRCTVMSAGLLTYSLMCHSYFLNTLVLFDSKGFWHVECNSFLGDLGVNAS